MDYTVEKLGIISVSSDDLIDCRVEELTLTYSGQEDQVIKVLYRPACGDRTFMLYWVDKFGIEKRYPFGEVSNAVDSEGGDSYIKLNEDYTTTNIYRHEAERTIELSTGLIESDEYNYCATVLMAQKAWYYDKYGIERVVLVEGENDDTSSNYKDLEVTLTHEEKTIR